MPNSRHITAATIAAELELSRTTVSAVLSGRAERHRIADSTVRRVLSAARKLNYRPNAAARQLAGKRSNSVGVLVTSELMIDLRLIELIEILASERGVRFMVGHAVGSPEQVKEYLADFHSRGVDAVISFFHNHLASRGFFLPELFRFRNLLFYEPPIDLDGRTIKDLCYVGPDFYEVGRLGVQHLIDRGKRRIGLMLREPDFPYAIQRRRAFEETLKAAGYPTDNQLVWVMTERAGRNWTAPLTVDIAVQAIEELVKRQNVDGIVAVNDLYAASLITSLRKMGYRVPEDVAVVGCDNLDFGTFTDPAITTIDLRLDEIAKAIVAMLFDLLDGRPVPDDQKGVIVKPELVVRDSA
jgi:DNA-binding LacI/PurR family transcriptional regulator